MSSAINSQIWNAKAANVQNADGSPIYAAGVWSFKSSTNVVTFSVSDAGVVTTASSLTAGNGADSATVSVNASTGATKNASLALKTAGSSRWFIGSGQTYNYDGETADALWIYNATGAIAGCAARVTQAGAWTFPVSVKSGSFSVSATTATATTAIALPAAGTNVYMVTIGGVVSDAVNYGAWALIAKCGNSARILTKNDATFMTITLSGMNVQVTQSSGGTQTVVGTWLILG